jgi:hypothetical protein
MEPFRVTSLIKQVIFMGYLTTLTVAKLYNLEW